MSFAGYFFASARLRKIPYFWAEKPNVHGSEGGGGRKSGEGDGGGGVGAASGGVSAAEEAAAAVLAAAEAGRGEGPMTGRGRHSRV